MIMGTMRISSFLVTLLTSTGLRISESAALGADSISPTPDEESQEGPVAFFSFSCVDIAVVVHKSFLSWLED
jgi:hypothetical protein